MGNTYIELKKLVYNTGQIEGVPRNPRKWTKEDVTALAASIVETPELFEAPFEEVTLDEGVYDMALTSPPYFDVEQYRGGSRRTRSSRNTSYGWRASIVHLSQRLTGRCGPEGTSAFRWARSRTRSATTRCA